MKKTDTLTKIISLLLFLAMAAYLSVYLVRRFVNPVQTALTVTATMTDSSSVTGLVFRDELLIKSTEDYIDVVVTDGEKVGAGQTVAVSYRTQEALEQAAGLHALAREIDDVKSSLDDTADSYTAGSRDRSIFTSLTGLSAALRSNDFSGIDAQESALASLLFRKEASDATLDYLHELETAYSESAGAISSDTTEITVGESGTFSSVIDGFEGVNPEYAQDLTPSSLRSLIEADRVVDQTAIGKLITSYYWYYAAIVSEADASRLVSGMTVELSFGRYYSENITADVIFVGRAEGSEQLVIFRMDKGFADMLTVRAVSAEIVYSDYSGLRVPIKSLYRYYAGYLEEADAALLSDGDSVTLSLGGADYRALVSEIGSAAAYGELPAGTEPGSEEDSRPRHCLVVFCWPWEDTDPPNFSAGNGTVTLADGLTRIFVNNYYEYNPTIDRMCVFTMTGLQAERKKVDLIYAGEEYCLVSSDGDDALREGNEVIAQAAVLYNGRVFQ